MDSQPISFTGRLTLEDVLYLHRYQALRRVRPSIRWLLGVVSSLLAATIITIFVFGGFSLVLSGILVLCAYFPVGWWYERLWMVRRHYKQHPEHYIENTVTMDENNVSISNVNMNLRLAWKQVARVLDTPRGLIFMMPTQVLFYLPQRLFEANEYKQSIIGYAIENKIPVRLMK